MLGINKNVRQEWQIPLPPGPYFLNPFARLTPRDCSPPMESQGYDSDSTIVAEAGTMDSGSLKKKPFPTVQLSIICLTQFAEPIASAVIYPFIIPLVLHTGVTRGDEAKIGYYAGVIVILFFDVTPDVSFICLHC